MLEKMIKDWETYKHIASKSELKPTLNFCSFDTDKLVIVPFGDLHIGTKYFDEKECRRIVDWCVEENAYAIFMGDMIETATRDSVGAGVYEQEEILEKQIEHFYDVIGPLIKNKLVLGYHIGNHEARLYNSSGLNIVKQMCRELKIPYFGWGKLHYFKVKEQGYTMYTTHGSSGARLPHTKIKGALDLANLAEAEIYCMGHLHQLSHHVRNFYDSNLRKKTVEEKQKHFLLCGSYLNHWGSYGHVKNYEPVRKGSPKIKLSGTEHNIRISL